MATVQIRIADLAALNATTQDQEVFENVLLWMLPVLSQELVVSFLQNRLPEQADEKISKAVGVFVDSPDEKGIKALVSLLVEEEGCREAFLLSIRERRLHEDLLRLFSMIEADTGLTVEMV